MMLASPITIGRHFAYHAGSASVLAMISGPMPAASPIVIPIVGRLVLPFAGELM